MESIAELSGRIRKRALSPVALAEACLDRIASVEASLHAFIHVDVDGVLGAARVCEREIAAGAWRGPLHGIPYGIKDICDVRSVRTTGGSRVLQDAPAGEDSAIVALLRAAGAILVGKTNLHELAFGPLGTNPHFGDTRNPWDLERHSGGSSGGSAAAVAADMCVFAIGSDTTGSIRIPASFCGIVGLKPTYGLVDAAGSLPLAWSLDHFGPMTRCVDDAAAVLDVIAGCPRVEADNTGRSISPLRIGVLRDFLEQAEPDVADRVEGAIADAVRMGCTIVDVRLRKLSLLPAAAAAIVHAEALAFHSAHIEGKEDCLAPDVRERFRLATLVSGAEYVNAQRVRRTLFAEVSGALAKCDVLACPTEPIGAPRLDEPLVTCRGAHEPKAAVVTRFTRLFNLTGHPAITVPCGFDAHAMPVGLQLVAAHGAERKLLRAAALFESPTQRSQMPRGLATLAG